MKQKRKIFSILLAGFLVLPSVLCTGKAEADNAVYVNDGGSVLSGGLSSAYAVGGNGSVSAAGGTYVITGDGIQQIGQPSAPTTGVPEDGDDGTTVKVKVSTARVGLYYYYSDKRNTALSFANLENKVGSGYQLGYYDSARCFHSVASTGVTTLTMTPDLNTALPAGTVGAYHIKLPTAYTDFISVQKAAAKCPGGFPAYINGTYYVMSGNYQSANAAAAAKAASGLSGDVFTGSARSVLVTKTGTTTILFEFDCGTSANLAVHPVSSSKAVTWFKNLTYYGDFEYFRCASDKLTVINIVNIEDYVKGVVTVEMSSSWPVEALKAQALCARSYFATNVNTYAAYGFDVTADTYSQAYRGTGSASLNSDAAVDATAGEYVTYGGAVCSTLFFSSDGGGTENSENIFTSPLPYLRGVCDTYEAAVPDSMNRYKSWEYDLTGAQLAVKLKNYGYCGGDVTSVQPCYSNTNNVIKLVLTDANGASATLTKLSCSSALGLPSVHYTVTQSAGTFVFKGGGWGHNVGMSQFGAYAMAQFYNLNYRQIIRFYYTGVNISDGVMA